MLSPKDVVEIIGPVPHPESSNGHELDQTTSRHGFWSRDRYSGAILYNFAAFVLPALYGTLSKLWIANIDTSLVVTVDSYTYIGVVAGLSQALILFQSVLGLLVSFIILGATKKFAASFVPVEFILGLQRRAGSGYDKCHEGARSAGRAVSYQYIVNILLVIPRFHVVSFVPSVNTQAGIRLGCEFAAAFSELGYFLFISMRLRRKNRPGEEDGPRLRSRPNVKALLILLRPGILPY
ncbi:uncharacterized protein Z518_09083 [Rhinocladiella mackenziei CBS 650.93]|uniref:Uncharacterized protein n=1 Tax=Rhinocladiella mackenziei CBS 650.93 TaxID=1442369 RepID=A0A0D2GSK2_9EURO|nr:uncharacterized protein Z518_09083 [Rhinocladiella mackenziei CBS 650.93]KIX01358.1 hypothetical protein Z518_09083 [Rhinocladiella mackenziei CBS 650.93]